jgi:hypothetical protein
VIVVLSRDGIITQQKTPPNRAIHDMNDRNLIRPKHFSTSQPSHQNALPKTTSTNTTKCDNSAAAVNKDAVSPMIAR